MGVSTHSQNNPPLYIFSVFRSDRKPEENEETHAALLEYFSVVNTPVAEVEGRYEGKHELSILVSGSAIPEELVQVISRDNAQEYYLVLENHKHGLYKAIFTDVKSGEKKIVGYMRSIDKETVDRLNLDYTYRKDVDKYFTIWPTDSTMMNVFEAEKLVVEVSGWQFLRDLFVDAKAAAGVAA